MPITIIDDTILSVNDDVDLNRTIDNMGSDMNEEIESNDINKLNYLNEFAVLLQVNIDYLNEEIRFLREDTQNKTIIINNLLGITRQLMNNSKPESESESSTISTSDCSNNIFENKDEVETSPLRGGSCTIISNILDELMATPIRKIEHNYEYFPPINESDDEGIMEKNEGDAGEGDTSKTSEEEFEELAVNENTFFEVDNYEDEEEGDEEDKEEEEGEDKNEGDDENEEEEGYEEEEGIEGAENRTFIVSNSYSNISNSCSREQTQDSRSSIETVHSIPDENNFCDEITSAELNSTHVQENVQYNYQSTLSLIRSDSSWNSITTTIDPVMDTTINQNTSAAFQDINNKYNEFKGNNNVDIINVYEHELNASALWKRGTILIIGDSMLYGLDESRLKTCKVRIYPGASIEDMHYNLIPLLRKKPTTIIVHAGANNCVNDNSTQIIEKLLRLKDFILQRLPNCKVIFSSLVYRFDDAKAQLTTLMTNKNFKNLGEDIIDNSNIGTKHLGRIGLHMTPYGTSRLAMNIIRVLKML